MYSLSLCLLQTEDSKEIFLHFSHIHCCKVHSKGGSVHIREASVKVLKVAASTRMGSRLHIS
jgi:hypothetical protein